MDATPLLERPGSAQFRAVAVPARRVCKQASPWTIRTTPGMTAAGAIRCAKMFRKETHCGENGLLRRNHAPAGGRAQTENYPAKPVRIISPFPPGGSVDLVGRLVAARLSESLGQQVIVDNRTGASGTIGTELAARAAPDGYTLLVNTLPLVT